MATLSDLNLTQNEYEMNTYSSFYADPSSLLLNSSQADPEKTLEIQEITKLFKKLTENQRNYFLSSLIKVFGLNFVRKLNLTLESLKHSDFEYKRKKPKLPAPAEAKQIKPSTVPETKPTKLPSINIRRRGSIIVRRNSIRQSSTLNQLVEEEEGSKSVLSTVPKQTKKIDYNIDKFTLRKSLEVIDIPWSLAQVTSRNKQNETLFENTDNLVSKLKDLFVSKYSGKDCSMFVSVQKKKETPKHLEDMFKEYDSLPPSREFNSKIKRTNSFAAVQEDIFRSNSFIRSMAGSRRTSLVKSSRRNSSTLELNTASRLSSRQRKLMPEELKGIYIKKLQNNYYDRKLWNTLVNSNSLSERNDFNIYTERMGREYDNEFSILTHSDWTDSTFAKSISRYTESLVNFTRSDNPPEKLRSATNSTKSSIRDLNNSQLTTYQDAINKTNKEIRVKHLRSLMKFIPVIKTWSSVQKQNLMQILLENESKSSLQHLVECVVRKVRPVPLTIDSLPDNVLLNVFSHLEPECLDNVAHVCNRWNYLASTPELWLFKCKKLGTRENIHQIEATINDLSNNKEIDWRQAFIELQEFVNSEAVKHLRIYYYNKLRTNAKAVRPKAVVPVSVKRDTYKRNSKNSDAGSYDNFYVAAPVEKLSESEDEFNEQNSLVSFKSKLKDKRKSKSTHLSRINESRNSAGLAEPSLGINNDNNETYFKFSENGNQIIKDFTEIKTDLVPTKDLLSTTKPAYRLKWKLADEDLKPYETVVFNLSPIVKVQSLNNHRKKITCLDYDKNRIVTGSLDQLIYVYDFKTGTCLGKLVGHKGGIKCLQILKNRLCSGSWDQTLIIWNMIHFERIITLQQNDDSVSCIYFDMNYLIFGSHDTRINVWRFNEDYYETSKRPAVECRVEEVVIFERLIEHHKSGISCLTYDGIDCIISGNTQGSILLIDINGNLLKELIFTTQFEPITSIKLVGALIISSTLKGKIAFWNRRNNKLESVIKCNDEEVPVNSVAYYNKRFYTADGYNMIKEWDLGTFTCLRAFKAHEGPVLDLVVAQEKIISCGYDKVIIWNMNVPKKKLQ